MATYSGSIETFSKMIGPRLRNIVQSKIARKYKNSIGRCEICQKPKDEIVLEAAHVTGKERPLLLKKAYEVYLTADNTLINVDLEEFERKFIELHLPLEDTFKILCKPCHQEYDKVDKLFVINDDVELLNLETDSDKPSEFIIELYPEDKDEFTENLLLKKSAKIKIFYNNEKSPTTTIWKATKFNENSDILKNLRSRTEFRKENREKEGICKILVSVEDY